MIVLDTSALVDFWVGSTATAERVRTAVGHERIAAPYAVDLEFVSVLRRLVLGRKLPKADAERVLDLFRRAPLRRFDHLPLLPRIWQLRHNLWPYDAAFIALSELLGVDLLTIDSKLAATPGLRCHVRNLRENS